MKKLVTHNNKFHLDDIFACATLQLYLDKTNTPYQVIRTRDVEIIKQGDYVFDVGGIYNPETNQFDHHQAGGAGVRENTIPYASFGLVWKKFGIELCSKDIAEEIDLKIVSGIDAIDNGTPLGNNLYKDIKLIDLSDLAVSFMPTWKNQDEKFFLDGFESMVTIAKEFLSRKIARIHDRKEADAIIESVYQKAEDRRLIILDQYYPRDQLSLHPEPLFVVFPDPINNVWVVGTVQNDPENFISRKELPKAWAGLRDQELAKISGVDDAIFCHRNLFIMTAKTKEGALLLARKALEAAE